MENPSVHPDDARFLQLLERWLQGDFTRSDEQQLRALLETDDFRREAWEGITALPEVNHTIQLEALRHRLKRRQAKRIPLAMWSALAAALLLLIAAIYFLGPGSWNERPPMAQTERPPQPGADQTPEGIVAAVPEAAPQERWSEPKGSTATEKPGKAPSVSDAETGSADDQLASEEQPATRSRSSAASKASGSVASAADTAPVVGGPANYQQISPANLPPDMGPAGNAVSPPPASPMPAGDSARTQQEAAAPEQKKAAVDLAAQPAEPAGGWDNFYRYLRQNARLSDAARNHNISGYVRLQFTVDANGKPTNLTVLRALGYGCEAEAQRLVGLFNWSPAGSRPVTVEVPFVR